MSGQFLASPKQESMGRNYAKEGNTQIVSKCIGIMGHSSDSILIIMGHSSDSILIPT